MGMTGITKNKVMKRMPFLRRNCAAAPHVPQRMSSEVISEPQKKTLVPIMSMQQSPLLNRRYIYFSGYGQNTPQLARYSTSHREQISPM